MVLDGVGVIACPDPLYTPSVPMPMDTFAVYDLPPAHLLRQWNPSQGIGMVAVFDVETVCVSRLNRPSAGAAAFSPAFRQPPERGDVVEFCLLPAGDEEGEGTTLVADDIAVLVASSGCSEMDYIEGQQYHGMVYSMAAEEGFGFIKTCGVTGRHGKSFGRLSQGLEVYYRTESLIQPSALPLAKGSLCSFTAHYVQNRPQ
ncbi:hypothetical protein KIPB_013835, partial [Kipferlia bialata]|eukprot:g13835.t1